LTHIVDAPPSWSDQELLARVIPFETSIWRALCIHGALVLARTHPDFPESTAIVIDQVIDHLERTFEAEGLEPPECGWRVPYVAAENNPTGGDREGSQS